ncbi:MAG: hypothetical protein ACOC5E_00610 [Acidobacteriota bacterium]
MARTPPSRMTFLILAGICLAVAASMAIQVSRAMREDFYWTPPAEAPVLADARDRVEVDLEGELLQRHAAEGRLLLREEDGTREVRPGELTVRTNEFDRVARGQVVLLTASTTAGLLLLAVGLAMPRRRRERG